MFKFFRKNKNKKKVAPPFRKVGNIPHSSPGRNRPHYYERTPSALSRKTVTRRPVHPGQRKVDKSPIYGKRPSVAAARGSVLYIKDYTNNNARIPKKKSSILMKIVVFI
ncbi:MAG: hypothetical protein HQK54_10235, partial [Oligoflexales bacterium]|nr:hypothetical protein [Oligoflexales bacterium]